MGWREHELELPEETLCDWFSLGMNSLCPMMKRKVSSCGLKTCACIPWFLFFLYNRLLCQDGQTLLVALIRLLLHCGWVTDLSGLQRQDLGSPMELHMCSWRPCGAESWPRLYGRGGQPSECFLGLHANLSALFNILPFPTKGSSRCGCPVIVLPTLSLPFPIIKTPSEIFLRTSFPFINLYPICWVYNE